MEVGAALAAVARERFLPPEQRRFAALDRPLPIGHDVSCSQPSTLRAMLELLGPRPGDRVLDVGCGSCWSTAVIAALVGPGGRVVGVEILPPVLGFGRANLGEVPNVELHLADSGVLGWPAGAPYDRILISADAPVLPEALVSQLSPGGVLVGPVAGDMLRVERHGRYTFVPLR